MTNHWLDTYPHKIYASVLLRNGKIVNWKVGQSYWRSSAEVNMPFAWMKEMNQFTVHHTFWDVRNPLEHSQVFKVDSKEWFKQWEVSEDFIGTQPYDKNYRRNKDVV